MEYSIVNLTENEIVETFGGERNFVGNVAYNLKVTFNKLTAYSQWYANELWNDVKNGHMPSD